MELRPLGNTELTADEWRERQEKHIAAIRPFTANFRRWRGVGQLHPVYDFLFTYYTYSTMKLERWHPGIGVLIQSPPESVATSLLHSPLYSRRGTGVGVFIESLREQEVKQLRWVRDLCAALLERKPRFACYGLHEWAIVYRAPETRHSYPLRLSAAEIELAVEQTTFCCSHYDAFRFSSEPAKKLNVLQPGPDDRIDFEQAGCLHANMDLFKWSAKLSPVISSDLIRDCFELAMRAREIDMRASPYDFRSIGFEPICIETDQGRSEYRAAQEMIAEAAQQLRRRLHDDCEQVLADWQDFSSASKEKAHPRSSKLKTSSACALRMGLDVLPE